MKRFIALMLLVVMALSLVACGKKEENKKTEDDVLSKFPSDLQEWSAEDFNDYFKAIGLCDKDEYIYVQDHESYWVGTPIYEGSGYMDDAGDYFTAVFTVDDTAADCEEFLKYVKEHKTLTEDMGSLPLDHMCGKILFFYSFSGDEDFYQAYDKAVEELVKATGSEFDF